MDMYSVSIVDGIEAFILKLADLPDNSNAHLVKADMILETYNHVGDMYQLALSYGTSFFDAAAMTS